ncbi:MAG TPA: lipid-A-disaccharide synthase [Chitinophagales bacterium]|nr:lipid-A-disaccharide synthase [Chitinophagales bacterium]
MKYYIIAGEASGDLHGSNLVKHLSLLDEKAVFKGVGGDKLRNANVDILFGLERLAFMGFYEVLKNLRTIRRNFKEVQHTILQFQPDIVILIDYPGFNLRMAKWCKQNGFKVAYYISPKIWAWNVRRVEIIKMNVDLVLCILPFEESFYHKHNYNKAFYVGNPLLDVIHSHSELVEESVQKNTKDIIALLPGSRKQELKTLLPFMLETVNKFPNENFIITGISRLAELYPVIYPQNVSIVFDKTYEVLGKAKAAVVCSGTATLETAILNVPQVVIYKTSWLNYQIGKRLAKVNFISLPNLIANKKNVEELIQQDCNAEKISAELNKLLSTSAEKFYDSLVEKIGEKGASERAAKLIIQTLSSKEY